MRPYPNIASELFCSIVLVGVCMMVQISYILFTSSASSETVTTRNVSIEVDGKCCRCASAQLLSALKGIPGIMQVDPSCTKDAICFEMTLDSSASPKRLWKALENSPVPPKRMQIDLTSYVTCPIN